MQDTKGTDWPANFAIFGQFFFYLLVFALVIALAYFLTRWIARARLSRGRASNLQVIESMSVGFQNVLLIVRAGGKFLLLGSSKDRIVFLAELDSVVEDTAAAETSFQKYLQQLIKPKPKE